MEKSQRQIIEELLLRHRRVTLRELFDAGVGYAGRNRIGEMRKDGWKIRTILHGPGQQVSDNAYELIGTPVSFQEENSGQLRFA